MALSTLLVSSCKTKRSRLGHNSEFSIEFADYLLHCMLPNWFYTWTYSTKKSIYLVTHTSNLETLCDQCLLGLIVKYSLYQFSVSVPYSMTKWFCLYAVIKSEEADSHNSDIQFLILMSLLGARHCIVICLHLNNDIISKK